MSDIPTLLPLIPALPLLAAILTAILGPKVLRGASHWPIVIGIAGSCIASLTLLIEVRTLQADASTASQIGFEAVIPLWNWATIDDAYNQITVLPSAGEAPVATAGQHDFRIDVVLRADALTCIMLSMVTFISTLVSIYAAGYMKGERGYWRFFAYVGLFVFSMTMLVSVSSFLLLFVFWEAVGVCSYLLIGFWYEKPSAAAAGKKAFLVNRIGDFGFTLAIFLIWTTYGTVNFHDSTKAGEPVAVAQITNAATDASYGSAPREPVPVNQAVIAGQASVAQPEVPGVLGQWRLSNNAFTAGCTGVAICLLLMVGACGKSAQFPLHVWLPDAMEGPTPVSALIHAATMVTAGVYMVTRCSPLFLVTPEARIVVSCIGGFTAMMAGIIAMTQTDLKRVLAYSTVSQLGYMFLSLGTGSYLGIVAGMFHLFTHAFFKALLFLGSGSVMHAMGGIIDMRRFSGLSRIMPITCITFAIGCVALAGIPPFAGFFSKDAILAAVQDASHAHGDYAQIYGWLYISGLVTAFLTAFYTFRGFFLTFFGELKIPHEAGHHAHESPPMMWIPLAILSCFAAFVGWGSGLFTEFIGNVPSLALPAAEAAHHPHADHGNVALVSSLIALAGVGLAAYMYLGHRREIEWLTWLLKFEWLAKLTLLPTAPRLGKTKFARALYDCASTVGLGWLASAVGYVVLLVIGIAALPLLLVYYFAPYRLSLHKFYFDEIYDALIVAPLRYLAKVAYWIDQHVIDRLVDLVGLVPKAIGALMRSLQMGLVQFYALAMVLGVLVLVGARLLWAS